MGQKSKRQLVALAAIMLASMLFAMAYAPIIGQFQGFETPLPVILQFALHGLIFGAILGWFELFYFQSVNAEWFRRQPFFVTLLVKTSITTLTIIVVLLVGGMMLFPERLAEDNAMGFFVVDVFVATVLAFGFQLVLTVRAVIGGRVLGNLVLGRYHRPLREERVFMFLDLVGSTALAERLGDIAAQSLITRFFFDVAQATVAYGGETHRYVGDEVVVTWPMNRGIEDAACLRCCFAVEKRLAERADEYLEIFGLRPKFRIGLHGGFVVAAECGDDKHEIVYFGDTINTAARIEQYCKEAGRSLLISAELLARMTLPASWKTEHTGHVRLRGRASDTEIYSVSEA